MARQSAAQKPRAVLRHQCGSCDEVFTGKTCPNCGEKVDIFQVNAEGIPLDEVANAVGSTHSLPITLQRSPDLFDPDFELEAATKRQMKDVMQEAQLDKVRASAAVQAAKRIRAEKELEETEKGFSSPMQGEPNNDEQGGFASMSPGIFLQALGGWDPEQREQFLNQLASNPMLALNLSMMMNPGKAGGMNQMGMMNPMTMLGQAMQQPVEQAPQESAADMVTAMIAGMTALKEMGGGNDDNSQQMERMLDKMDEMRKETEDLKLKLIESQNKKPDMSHEDIRRIVADAVNTTTDGKIGLINGLKEIHTLRDELITLGIASEPSTGIDPAQTLEERKFDHQVKVDDRKDKQEHELRLKSEEAAVAKANIQSEFVTGLFAASQENDRNDVETSDTAKPVDVVKADTSRQPVVIS